MPDVTMDRRALLRRSAVVGAAMWTTPVVESLSRRALAQGQVSPDFGDGPALSNAMVVLTVGGVTYRVKAEDGTESDNAPAGSFHPVWERDPGPPRDEPDPPHCTPTGWRAATAADGTALGVQVVEISHSHWEVTLPDGAAVAPGGARAKAGQLCLEEHSRYVNERGLTVIVLVSS